MGGLGWGDGVATRRALSCLSCNWRWYSPASFRALTNLGERTGARRDRVSLTFFFWPGLRMAFACMKNVQRRDYVRERSSGRVTQAPTRVL